VRPLLACLALAALSLLVLQVPSYDPSAWLIWGREITEGTLSMTGGPSWKPLPVAFTTAFAPLGSGAAPLLWLLVARTSGFVAVVMMFRVARRLGGDAAGWIAAAGLLLATDFLFNVLRGDSEGMLVALALIAIDLDLRGRRRAAFVVGALCGLLRPEVWLLLAAVALRRRHLALSLGAGLVILAAWFLPDYLSTGDWLRGANRARHPVPGSPGQSAFPFGLTFAYASISLAWPLYAGAVYAVIRARRDARAVRGEGVGGGDRTLLGIAAAAAVLMLAVATLAELGFTGNIRYVTLPAALVCLLGGVGLPPLVGTLAPRWRQIAAFPAGLAVAASLGIVAWSGVRLARDEREFGTGLDHAIAAAGGAAAVRACGQVATGKFERQNVAYELHLPSAEVWTHAVSPGLALQRSDRTVAGATQLPVRARVDEWTVRARCR
jgi:hypothetical protein